MVSNSLSPSASRSTADVHAAWGRQRGSEELAESPRQRAQDVFGLSDVTKRSLQGVADFPRRQYLLDPAPPHPGGHVEVDGVHFLAEDEVDGEEGQPDAGVVAGVFFDADHLAGPLPGVTHPGR